MEQSPSRESNISLSPAVYETRNFHCHFRNSAPIINILKLLNVVYASSFCYFDIDFNIVLPSTPRSCKWSPSLTLSTIDLYVRQTPRFNLIARIMVSSRPTHHE